MLVSLLVVFLKFSLQFLLGILQFLPRFIVVFLCLVEFGYPIQLDHLCSFGRWFASRGRFCHVEAKCAAFILLRAS